jgi:hypothetical protein
MKVYVVLHTWGGTNAEVEGVFSSESKADAAIARSVGEFAESELDETEQIPIFAALSRRDLNAALTAMQEQDHYWQVETIAVDK